MVAGHGEHERSAPSVLADEAGDHGEEVGERDRSGGFGGGVVDPRAAGRELGDVDPGASPVAERAGEPAGGLEDGFDGVLGRCEDVAVGVRDLQAADVEASVGEDPSSEEELLLRDHPSDVLVAPADPVEPFVEGLVVVAVLLGPNVDAELIVGP